MRATYYYTLWSTLLIESRSNLFYFIVDVSATSVAFVEMTSGSDFPARCRCCGEKCVVELWQGICPRISVRRVSLNILLANFDRFSDPSCWAVTFSAQDAGFIPSYDVIFLYHMICYSGFVLLFIDRLLPLPCKLWEMREHIPCHISTTHFSPQQRHLAEGIGTGSHFDKGNRCCRNVNNKIERFDLDSIILIMSDNQPISLFKRYDLVIVWHVSVR